MNSVTLKIDGMHCEGCATTIKAVIDREPGAASVAFEGGEARILYDPLVISEDRLAAAVGRLGFRVVGRRL